MEHPGLRGDDASDPDRPGGVHQRVPARHLKGRTGMLSRSLTSATFRVLARLLVVVLLGPAPLWAQGPPGGQGPPAFKPEELDQIAAPIALYPDPLVAQILMASTYPLEIVQAARFAKANANLKGEQLNEALKKQTWDDS